MYYFHSNHCCHKKYSSQWKWKMSFPKIGHQCKFVFVEKCDNPVIEKGMRDINTNLIPRNDCIKFMKLNSLSLGLESFDELISIIITMLSSLHWTNSNYLNQFLLSFTIHCSPACKVVGSHLTCPSSTLVWSLRSDGPLYQPHYRK